MSKSWLYLIGAILFEVSGTTCMKLSEGFERLIPSILIFVFYSCSFSLMTLAIKHLEVSIVYAIWSGIGMALITTIGIFVFDESASLLKLISILLIMTGIIGLNWHVAPR
jgi:small multidrug resistance pump